MTPLYRAIIALIALPTVLWAQCGLLCAQEVNGLVAAEANDIAQPIRVTANHQEILQQENTTIITMRGGMNGSGLVELTQGELQLTAETMVVFDRVTADGHDVLVYAEGRVQYTNHGNPQRYAAHQIRLQALSPVSVDSKLQSEVTSPSELMRKAATRMAPGSKNTTSTVSLQGGPDSFTPPQFNSPSGSAVQGSRRIRIRPRSSQPLQFDSFLSRDTVPEEQVYVLTGGVNILIDGVQLDGAGQLMQPGVLDLSADRIIIWTDPSDSDKLAVGQALVQAASRRLQIYLEGNILVRQQDNTITATRAFFDANNDRALLMNAELRAQLPQTGGEFRIRAEKLRRLSENKFHAQNAWTSTSPYGQPGYRVQASDIFVEPGPVSPFTKVDPNTGQPVNGPPLWMTALNPQFILGNTPILGLPKITAPIEDPNIPIRRAVVKQDRVFGFQVKTVWNLSKLLGQPTPKGMDWDLMADYLSERGPAIGVQGDYDMQTNLGRAIGSSTLIYQHDDGADNLGADRRSLSPDNNNRGAIIMRHNQFLPGQAQLFGEIGYLSDRNYLESFHEPRYDTDKDVETLIGARQDLQAWSGSLMAKTELNEFEASTDWLPKGDLYSFSQPIFGGLAYHSSHSSVGYADLEPGRPPSNLNDPFTPLALPYVNDASGLVAMTRHQVDAPFMLGPVNINPFVMGEAAFWDEGLTAKDIDRYVFSTGVQAHLSATKIMPFIRSDLWNLNGLAHKSDAYLEYRYTESSRDLSEISQYNEIDDNSTERFRGRYTTQIFPGLIPAEFDPRYYAVRNGAGMWISAPYHELVNDQETLRLRWRNRLQTKVGPVGQERIRDWMIWESGVTWFPKADRDNFGEDFGLIYGNYRWNINDRTSILADGIVDLFDNAQDVWSLGVLSQRSTRGSVYLGYRKVEAKNYLDSQTLVASYSYQMSPKWISTGSIAYDVAAGESRGSSLTFSRVGLDWVVHVGLGIDTSKDNVGIAFAVEPRFGPPSPTNLSYLLGLGR